MKSVAWLDEVCPLVLSNEEMDRLGGEEKGYEQVRSLQPDPSDFAHRFSLDSAEHREWLSAMGTL